MLTFVSDTESERRLAVGEHSIPIEAVANELRDAELSRVAIPPVSERFPSFTIADAYAVQSLGIERRLKAGSVVAGRKVGLTSVAMQQQLGVSEPDFGVLLNDMVVGDGDGVPTSELLQPRVESEIAFVLDRDLAGPGVTAVKAIAATGGVVPAIEIIDSRIENWKISLVDTIADNASSARVVLGGKVTKIDGFDLKLVGVVFSHNGVVTETGSGAAVLGNPARCVAWLANKLAEFGECLRAGDVVLAGSLHRAIAVVPGAVISAEFDHLGTVSVHFS
jgi:2-keto-4-pentenoate hydratase